MCVVWTELSVLVHRVLLVQHASEAAADVCSSSLPVPGSLCVCVCVFVRPV